MIKNIVETIGSFGGRGQNIGERLIQAEHKKRQEQAMQVAHVLGSVANDDLRFERPESEQTLFSFKEILHEHDLAIKQWPAGWQALRSYFGE